jgi:hypothetical protein
VFPVPSSLLAPQTPFFSSSSSLCFTNYDVHTSSELPVDGK